MPDEKLMQEQMDETRRQMGETRASLAAKLDTLESKVADTVQGATDTFESVKESVQGATDTFASVKESVGNTVDSVKESVEETVQSVRDTFHETVTAVSDSLDISAHVARHPWPMLGGAVALGFLAGRLLPVDESTPAETAAPPMEHGNGPSYASARHNGRGKKHEPRPAPEPSWMQNLVTQFEPELDKFKYMAIGSLVNIVHDLVAPKVPESFRSQFTEVMNDITQKLTSPEPSAQAPAGKKRQDFSSEAHRFAG